MNTDLIFSAVFVSLLDAYIICIIYASICHCLSSLIDSIERNHWKLERAIMEDFFMKPSMNQVLSDFMGEREIPR